MSKGGDPYRTDRLRNRPTKEKERSNSAENLDHEFIEQLDIADSSISELVKVRKVIKSSYDDLVDKN